MSTTTGIIIGLSILTVRIIYHYLKQKKEDAEMEVEAYALHASHFKSIKELIIKRKFEEADNQISNLSDDELTICIDYLCLILKENDFQAWLQKSQNKDIPNLFLGVHYDFLAWQARSHKLGNEVKEKDALTFLEFEEKAMEQFYNVDETGQFGAETHNRLIRTCRSLERDEDATLHFHKAIELNPNLLAAYINHAENVQPKWGGNYDLIHDLLNSLPEQKLIQQVVKLKLIWDAFVIEDNYFGKNMEDLTKLANTTIQEIDKELSNKTPSSIQKYIAYIYMFFIAYEIDNTELTEKYFENMEGSLAIYTHGVVL